MLSADQIQAAIAAIESGDPEAMKAVLTEILAALATGETPGEGEPETEPADDAPGINAADAEEPEERATDAKDEEPEANAVIRGLQAQVNELLAERESRELGERRGLIAKLVSLGVETPATAWSGKPEDRKPCKRLADEPLAEMRSRVAAMAQVRSAAPEPPAKVPADTSTLSRRELDACKKRGIDPQDYIAQKAAAVRSRHSTEATQ